MTAVESSPRCSLIVTVSDPAPFVAAAIRSIRDQSAPDFEALVWCDGWSPEIETRCRELIGKDPRFKIVAAEKAGLSASLRAAIEQTSAPYLGWVDSDDWIGPHCLERCAAALDARPDVGMVYTHHAIVNENGEKLGLGARCAIRYSRSRLLVDFMTFHFRLLRRSVYEQVGGIDPSFTYAQDYDLCLRVSEVTRIRCLPEVHYYYRRHSGQISQERKLEQRACSARAVQEALLRRGAAEVYRLIVDDGGSFSVVSR